MRKDIIDTLKRIRPDIDYETENQLISLEMLDSYDIIYILAELSEQFKVEIDPEDVTEEYFDSVDRIERLICSKLKGN